MAAQIPIETSETIESAKVNCAPILANNDSKMTAPIPVETAATTDSAKPNNATTLDEKLNTIAAQIPIETAGTTDSAKPNSATNLIEDKTTALVTGLNVPENTAGGLKAPEDARNSKQKEPEIVLKEPEQVLHGVPIPDPGVIRGVLAPNPNVQVDNEGTIWFCPPKSEFDPPRKECPYDKPAKVPQRAPGVRKV